MENSRKTVGNQWKMVGKRSENGRKSHRQGSSSGFRYSWEHKWLNKNPSFWSLSVDQRWFSIKQWYIFCWTMWFSNSSSHEVAVRSVLPTVEEAPFRLIDPLVRELKRTYVWCKIHDLIISKASFLQELKLTIPPDRSIDVHRCPWHVTVSHPKEKQRERKISTKTARFWAEFSVPGPNSGQIFWAQNDGFACSRRRAGAGRVSLIIRGTTSAVTTWVVVLANTKCHVSILPEVRGERSPVFNAEFINFNTRFIILNPKFIILIQSRYQVGNAPRVPPTPFDIFIGI